jgi:hypothetical protein
MREICVPQKAIKHLLLPALVLAIVASANFYPALTQVAGSKETGSFSLDATGNATGKKNGPQVPASLSIAGNAVCKGDDDDDDDEDDDYNGHGSTKVRGLTGTLMIGNNSFPIYDGKGELHLNDGKFEIEGKANGNNGKKSELVLHGYLNGNTAFIQSPQSKLASMYFLSMQGNYTLACTTTTQTGTGTSTVTVTETTYITVTTTETVANTTLVITTTETVANTTFVTTTTETIANTTITVTATNTTAPP